MRRATIDTTEKRREAKCRAIFSAYHKGNMAFLTAVESLVTLGVDPTVAREYLLEAE